MDDASGKDDATPVQLGYRWPAEWEPQASVWLSWPRNPNTWPGHFEPVPAEFAQFVRLLAEYEPVNILAGGSDVMAQARSLVGNLKNGEQSTFTKERWDPTTWPAECEGVGLSEAPRGALAHWIRIKDRKIDNYQLVVPSTWNASPRDAKGNRSAYEESLIGTPVAKDDEPLEIIRTIHSFDPCLACAVHLYDPEGNHVHQIQVN